MSVHKLQNKGQKTWDSNYRNRKDYGFCILYICIQCQKNGKLLTFLLLKVQKNQKLHTEIFRTVQQQGPWISFLNVTVRSY